jgi:hypothetical protein
MSSYGTQIGCLSLNVAPVFNLFLSREIFVREVAYIKKTVRLNGYTGVVI